MKYAKEIMGLMRAYPGRAFSMRQLISVVAADQNQTLTHSEAVRKGIRRVLGQLIEAGLVIRLGGPTKSATYAWQLLGHKNIVDDCRARTHLGQ